MKTTQPTTKKEIFKIQFENHLIVTLIFNTGSKADKRRSTANSAATNNNKDEAKEMLKRADDR